MRKCSCLFTGRRESRERMCLVKDERWWLFIPNTLYSELWRKVFSSHRLQCFIFWFQPTSVTSVILFVLTCEPDSLDKTSRHTTTIIDPFAQEICVWLSIRCHITSRVFSFSHQIRLHLKRFPCWSPLSSSEQRTYTFQLMFFLMFAKSAAAAGVRGSGIEEIIRKTYFDT